MRKLNRLFLIFLCLMMAAGLSCMTAFAETDDAGVTYTVTVYSGNSGTFSDGSTVKVINGLHLGDEVQLNINSDDYKPVLNDDVADKYYARGFKIAGHDNDEISQLQLVNYKHKVDGDASFTVAYGMKGGLVKYTVNYVDESGKELIPSEEYYGMAGDTPVVSYQYVEGYKPEAYNIGRTLKKNEEENVFNFVYTQAAATTTTTTVTQQVVNGGNGNTNANAGTNGGANGGTNGAGANNAAGGDGTGNAAATTDGTTINDNPTPQASEPEQISIEDSDTPQVEPEDAGLTDTQRQLLKAAAIGGGCVVVLAIALAALLIKRRKENQDTSASYDNQ